MTCQHVKGMYFPTELTIGRLHNRQAEIMSSNFVNFSSYRRGVLPIY